MEKELDEYLKQNESKNIFNSARTPITLFIILSVAYVIHVSGGGASYTSTQNDLRLKNVAKVWCYFVLFFCDFEIFEIIVRSRFS